MKRTCFIHCLIGVAAAVGVLLLLGVQAGTLFYLTAVLACPLMMVFMMRGMGHGREGCDHPDHQQAGSGDSSESAELSR